ncbi:MAG: type II toxin-antitoxin system ParD family antitoxin [Anaerolineae bacterium]|nr:type II toxin-antitoxin system ParD family antitoxin [Phycisphaerae bacterium]
MLELCQREKLRGKIVRGAMDMNISFRPHIQKFIDAKVESGQYDSPEELVEDALEQMKEQMGLTQQDIVELRELLDSAIAQADRGEFVEFTADSIIAEGLEALSKKRKVD